MVKSSTAAAALVLLASTASAAKGPVYLEVDQECSVWIDDVQVARSKGDASFRLEVEEGRHVVRAASPEGFATTDRAFDVVAGEITVVSLRPKPLGGSAPDACPVSLSRKPDAAPSADAPPCQATVPPGEITPPVKVKGVDPAFPSPTGGTGASGQVIFECVVDQLGHVQVERILRTDDASFVEAALMAVSGWEYTPALLNGKPQAVYLVVRVAFKT